MLTSWNAEMKKFLKCWNYEILNFFNDEMLKIWILKCWKADILKCNNAENVKWWNYQIMIIINNEMKWGWNRLEWLGINMNWLIYTGIGLNRLEYAFCFAYNFMVLSFFVPVYYLQGFGPNLFSTSSSLSNFHQTYCHYRKFHCCHFFPLVCWGNFCALVIPPWS